MPVKVCLSKPILVWLEAEREIFVLGNMDLGMIFSVLIGKKILGKLSFKLAPSSLISKN